MGFIQRIANNVMDEREKDLQNPMIGTDFMERFTLENNERIHFLKSIRPMFDEDLIWEEKEKLK